MLFKQFHPIFLDPTIINFLRGKNKNVGEAKNPTQAETRSGLQITKKMQKKTQSVLQQHADDEVDPYKVFGIQKDYVNMGKVEKEKLAWMKDLPKVLTRKVREVSAIFAYPLFQPYFQMMSGGW